ncbi:dynamin family protein [Guptibacillus algicola]|uniref:dynamin family protein n=1 Tax=Guptibacillus algicola TaxID=225844 RepID=UPI001CD52A0C|nr:dynamin family protein [Alkalihalobacillus algicola]MCA0988180.1 dynamin family protein [Alkalihalobacillus algicola]
MKNSQQTLNLQNTELLIKRLALIEKELGSKEASKMKQLMLKLKSGEQHFLFSGHFSAGKSTLINALFDTDLLPSSPIPASANTVRVRSGDPGAEVEFFNGKRMVFKAPYNIETVKDYCLNGDEVAEVELSAPSPFLDKDVVLIDTPGIDSTDEAHRLATENSMYVADVVFYVMDYNHVQSEVNYQFIRELHRQNKKIILIVNQIDKHKESELSFTSFKQSVASSFHAWGMSLESFFFISLRDRSHPNNQFEQLKVYIEGLAKKTEEDKVKSVYDSAQSLVQDVTDVLPEDEEVNHAHLKMQKTLASYQEKIDQIEQEFQVEASKITKGAMLMPYEVREAGRAYLESLQPGFKVGLIFRDKKTEQEREHRYETFVEKLQSQVKTQLEWHFQQLLLNLEEEAGINKSDDLKDYAISIDFSFLKHEAEKGTGATGEAVLHYTETIASRLKSQVKVQSEQKKNELILQLEEELVTLENEEKKKFENAIGEERAREYFELVEEATEVKDRLDEILNGAYDSDARKIQDLFEQPEKEVVVIEPEDTPVTKSIQKSEKRKAVEDLPEEPDSLPSRELTIHALHKGADTIEDLPGLGQTRDSFRSRADKLAYQSYTVALFGAFSAGKSSFANALIGKAVLPSSPNPTTATLNRICPVQSDRSHETADIFYKTEDELLKDIQHSLSFFGEKAFSIEDSLGIIEKGKIFAKESSDTKPHALFLKAVLDGKAQLDLLGKVRNVSMDDYKDLVVNESKACFIASISLYHDNPLTKEGITLVDTPGADSINARHTGVAFQYIKEADAILYVTYYNHAFSKADREFLIQLGRVKDVFEMDKMFFLLNAADLAKDEEELEIVEEHVESQLGQYGIRKPTLFPVSSLAAMTSINGTKEEKDILRLPARLREKGGVNRFEDRFYTFIQSDLSKMAIQSNWNELKRVTTMLQDWLNNFDRDSDEKEADIERLHTAKENAIQLVSDYSVNSTVSKIKQEIEELVHYIPQRLFYRFGDFYKEAFNPTTLNRKAGLATAASNLLGDLENDLMQEMRATSLRMDYYIQGALKTNYREFHLKINKEIPDFQSEIENLHDMETPQFEASLSELVSTEQIDKTASSEYRNSKQFFEQNGSAKLQDKLSSLLQEPVQQYVDKIKGSLRERSKQFYEDQLSHLKTDIVNDIERFVSAQIEMKTSSITKEDLSYKVEELQVLLNQAGEGSE